MNYIGSKLSLLDFIEHGVEEVTNGQYDTVCDLFAGTGSVGKRFKRKGKKIIANDLQTYSFVLNRHYIGNHKLLYFTGLEYEIEDLANSENKTKTVCDYLSKIDGKDGFIYKNYCLGGSGERRYFSDENGRLCDSVRDKIDEWKNDKKITEDEYYFLLCSLLESVDKVANTASVYGAFLKKLKKSAQKQLKVEPAELILNDNEHIILNKDANTVVRKNEVDVLYLDPPYNQRQYASNYHILETIVKNDNPKIKGKTGLRDYEDKKSDFCSKSKVEDSFRDLIKNAKAKYIFLSYNNEGLLSLDKIKEIMSSRGEYGVFTQEYNRFKADRKRKYSADKTIEYLHYVICK